MKVIIDVEEAKKLVEELNLAIDQRDNLVVVCENVLKDIEAHLARGGELTARQSAHIHQMKNAVAWVRGSK